MTPPGSPISRTVEDWLGATPRWRAELTLLRVLLLESDLSETMKWGKPCYTLSGRNVALLVGFKPHCAVLFVKGALMDNAGGRLITPGENTQAARQLRFTSVGQIEAGYDAILGHLRDAIDIERSGRTVRFRTPDEQSVPDEFLHARASDPALVAAFDALTAGRRRAYLMHFAAPKRSATRIARIGRCRTRILAGKGLNDR